jgi:predicted nucleic acid-binding protein
LLDTSVLVLGIVSRGSSRRLVQGVVRGDLKLITTPVLLNELEGVLVGEFSFSLEEARGVRHEIESLADVIHPAGPPGDRGDDQVLQIGLSGGVEAIVTQDRRLLEMGSWLGMRIMSPDQFERGE